MEGDITMKVTRDVVKDLLPLYLTGDASSDTRVLVEEWLREDADLARRVEQAGRLDLAAAPALPPTMEKQALDRTRKHLRWRTILLGFAIYVSTLPLTVTFDRSGFNGLLIDNWPERIVVITIALVLWTIYWRTSRRLRVAGL
jgi:ferric-dicitrate binding protein FerR (iron transport regulator)